MLSQKPWRAEAVIMLISGVFACICLGVLVTAGLQKAGVAGFKTTNSFGGVLVVTLSFQGAACVLMGVFFKLHEVDWRDAFGLRRPGLLGSLLLGLGVLVVAFPIVMALKQFSDLGLARLGWHPEDQHAVNLIAHAKSFWMRGYLVFFTVALVPVAEEFLFRGVLFPLVKQLGWPRLAWLGVSLLFALVHWNLPTLVPLFVLALVLTWLYEKTDRLLVPVAAHSLFNTINLVLLFIQS
jgi:membrane protease YdiL (CAAX protease family)